MILNDNVKEISVLLGSDALVGLEPYLLGGLHALVQLQVCDFLLYEVLLAVELQRVDKLRDLFYVQYVLVIVFLVLRDFLLLEVAKF